MRKSNLYVPLWEACLPKIKEALKDETKNFSLPLQENFFDALGERNSYSFRLELKNGKVMNNIEGSAVARDLYIVLSSDLETKKLLNGKKKVFRLDSAFGFHILNSGAGIV